MDEIVPKPPAAEFEPTIASPSDQAVELSSALAPTGRRQAFRAIRRHLSDDELSSPGVQRLILEDLERAESERSELQKYVDRFHEADKIAAVLRERVGAVQSLDIMFGVALGLGGTLIGMATTAGWQVGIVGGLLMLAGVIARIRR